MGSPLAIIARYTLAEALRNRLPGVALAVILATLLLGFLLGRIAIADTVYLQAVTQAAMLRGFAVFIIATLVIVSQVREASDKGLELLLSLPVPRAHYLLGKLLGYAAAGALLALAWALPLLLFAPPGPVVAWAISLACELAIVTAASLFFVQALHQAPAALAGVLGFYLLGRAMAALQLIGGSPVLAADEAPTRMLTGALNAIGFLLPRLDLFTQSAWLAPGGGAPALPGLFLQTAAYVALLAAAALFDLYRREI